MDFFQRIEVYILMKLNLSGWEKVFVKFISENELCLEYTNNSCNFIIGQRVQLKKMGKLFEQTLNKRCMNDQYHTK